MEMTFRRLVAVWLVSLQALVLLAIALITLVGSVVTQDFEVRVLLPELILYAAFVALLVWLALGLKKGRAWARAPMILVQLLMIGISYEDFFQSSDLIWQTISILLFGLAALGIWAAFSTD
jgi:hypothetical protein